MTSKSASELAESSRFKDHLCHLSGGWYRYRDLRLSIDDIGFRQGVIAVERMRTYGGRIFHSGDHLRRWQHTNETLGISGLPNCRQIEELSAELLDKNQSLVHLESDVGITLFATPGSVGQDRPTFAVHLNPLNHRLIEHRRAYGQPLVVTDVWQPSSHCWPRTIKVRSRIHYYLADAAARQQDQDAIGVLVDADGNVTETSIANLAIVRSGEIFSPPAKDVLGGITQSVIESLANELQILWRKEPLTGDELRQADEILLMGTDGGIWYASSIDGQPIGGGQRGPILQRLRERFDRLTRLA